MLWDDINLRLNGFLDDATSGEGETQFPLANRVAGWNFAVDYFGRTHTADEKTVDLKADTDGKTFILPVDFLEVGMLYDINLPYQTFVRKTFSVGSIRWLPNGALAEGYWIWGHRIWMNGVLRPQSQLRLDYYAK